MSGTRYRAYVWLIAALICAGCGKPAVEPEAVRPVRAIKVGDLKAIAGREFPGRAKARDEVDLSFQVSGPLVSLPVDVGSTVKKGDVIASIDPRDFQAALDTNQGNLERAKANLLAMERGARPEEIEQLKAAVTQAEASYKQASAEHERNANLVTTGAVSKSDFDITLARAERTAAEVKAAQEDLNIGLKGAQAGRPGSQACRNQGPGGGGRERQEPTGLRRAQSPLRRQCGRPVRGQFPNGPGQADDRSPVGCLEDRSHDPGAGKPDCAGAAREESPLPFRRLAGQGVRRPDHEDRQRGLANHAHLSRHRGRGSAGRRADSARAWRQPSAVIPKTKRRRPRRT